MYQYGDIVCDANKRFYFVLYSKEYVKKNVTYTCDLSITVELFSKNPQKKCYIDLRSKGFVEKVLVDTSKINEFDTNDLYPTDCFVSKEKYKVASYVLEDCKDLRTTMKRTLGPWNTINKRNERAMQKVKSYK